MKLATATVLATPGTPKHRLDPVSHARLAARKLEQNEIGICNLSLNRPVAFEPYAVNREMGGFILIDRVSLRTVGAGLLNFALRRAHNIGVQALDVSPSARAAIKGQQSCVLWLTGLPGAGKSTLANLIDRRLHAMGHHTYVLDGDNVRHGLSRDLGFTEADRVENVRRVAETARLMADAGLIVVVALDIALQAYGILNQLRVFAVSHEARSRINTAYVTCNFLGGALGSAAAALLWAAGGWTAITTAGIILSLFALAVWAVGRRGPLVVVK
jgi:bifunctional enzyme CysN/CysC